MKKTQSVLLSALVSIGIFSQTLHSESLPKGTNVKEALPPLSSAAKALKLGTYEHYSGKQYKVIAVARHSESLEEHVVYQALYGDNDFWVRPLGMFVEQVDIHGKQTPRFKYIG
ncbi:MAG: DUF1653 domain-containing protein [Legionellales bacterium]